jgi:3-hydroxyacyl-CoA dehydrogenase / enoyl-CoA hydratase / 3-hydroxybutyryl-CoA epimerase
VIRGPKTSDEATATIFELSKKMGKTPIVVKDGVGFLVNRLLIPYLIEAAFFLQEGMDIQKVDDVFVKKIWYAHGSLPFDGRGGD